ncbi:MAG TPA: helix-turn-helix domain-containing protein [Gammaproteobacteria bacterium]|jgi:HTH-type transcriptional regulator/antitoxin HipB|nr:helix-turn-helix domain-containing protein [Gammaproteobacteria bacterium]
MYIRSPKELALFIISQRKKYNLSQAKVGELVGLKQQTISEFELNPETTKLDTLFRILSAANLDMHITEKAKTKQKEEW